MISLCGVGGMCKAMKAGLLLAGLRINFNQRAPPAGFATPRDTVWDRSGSRFSPVRVHLMVPPGTSSSQRTHTSIVPQTCVVYKHDKTTLVHEQTNLLSVYAVYSCLLSAATYCVSVTADWLKKDKAHSGAHHTGAPASAVIRHSVMNHPPVVVTFLSIREQ